MRYRVVIELDTNKTVYEQIKRNGLSVVREGDNLAVKVPNRTISKGVVSITADEPKGTQ